MNPLILALLALVGGMQPTGTLDRLIEAKNAAAIRQLLQKNPATAKGYNANGISMLSRAAQTDCLPCVTALLDAGADPKVKDKDPLGRTPLHWSAGWSTLEVVRVLVGRGASLNVRTSKGATPLSFAQDNFYKDSTNERKKIMAYLAKAGAK